MSRSTREKVVRVDFINNGQGLPSYLGLIQKHFEKAQSPVASSKDATVSAPLDLLDLVLPEYLLNDLESISVRYRRRE